MPVIRRGRSHACILAALAAGACAETPAAEGRVVFRDDFDRENGMVSRADFHGLRQWEVAGGSVDLQGTYPFAYLPPGHGMYVDLDGSRGHAGTLRTRAELRLAPGEYVLRFSLAGTQWVSAPNTVRVSVGNVLHRAVTLPAFAPVHRYQAVFTVRAPTRAHIQFAQAGGDDMGLLLDDVELIRR
ncbi:MAG: motif putative anchor domain protein [Gemmatimonadetes bacterium]|nr:motif putative anchor domain protein [Gemmatimonadota bacterium]